MRFYKFLDISRLGKNKVVLAGVVFFIICGFLGFAIHLKLSKTAQYTYKILAEDLKKQGEAALKSGSYVVAKRFLERAMMFAEKANLPSLERQIRKTMENTEELKKISAGLVPFQGDWIRKEEFLKLYDKSRKAKSELYNLVSRAAAASAEGNYARAESYYEEAIKIYDEASWLIGEEYSRDRLIAGYNRALLLSSKQKADIDFNNGLFDQAANAYVRALDRARELNISDDYLLRELHRLAVESFIEAARKKLEAEDWQSFMEFIGKAREQLHRYNYLSKESLNECNQKITGLLRKAYIRALSNCGEIIQEMVKSVDASRTCLFVEKVNGILKNLMPTEKDGAPPYSSCVPSQRYEMAETLLKRALNVLEYASSNHNLGDLKETRTFLQQTLNLAQEKAAKDRALRKEFSMRIASLEEEAKRFTNAGKYDDAFRTYDEAIRLIRSSSFRGEGQYQDKLEEFLNSQKELIARIKGSHLEKSLSTMEDLLAKGKVEEIRHVAVDLNLGGNDSANPKIRRILWLQHISQNVRNFFREGIRREAVEFFGKRYQTDVKVKVEDVSLNKIVMPDYKPGSVCFDLRMNGSAILYTEMTRKFSASPFQCEVHVRVCEGSPEVYNGAQCQETKVKATLGPEPVTFGELKK